jgi:coenzyme F420-reducing hydrogenase delta subunit
MHAFESGADGVMVAGCQPGDCYFNIGNLVTVDDERAKFSLIREVAEEVWG